MEDILTCTYFLTASPTKFPFMKIFVKYYIQHTKAVVNHIISLMCVYIQDYSLKSTETL